jgi:pyruvate-formate lyase-activating enzyme
MDTEPSATALVNLNDKCNQSCVFCGSEGVIRAQSMREVNAVIRGAGDRLTISGWEPTLHPRLEEIVKRARLAGIRNITLFTNAVLLDAPAFARRLVAAGVRTFHVNFPAHEAKLSDRITGAPGSFRRRLAGVRNLLAAPGRKYVSLVFVINSLNYRTMPRYAEFVAENFPGLVHVLFSAVCVMGRAAVDPSVAARLSAVSPYLAAAQAALLRRRVKCLVDNVPLCLMPGFEHASFDARRAAASGRPDISGKSRRPACAGCTLAALCPGLRDDYAALRGDRELKASRRPAARVRRAIGLLSAAGL